MHPERWWDNEAALAAPPPAPTTAIYTKGDGVENWRTSLQTGENHGVHNIRVAGSHIGLNLNARVWFWGAKKLAEMRPGPIRPDARPSTDFCF